MLLTMKMKWNSMMNTVRERAEQTLSNEDGLGTVKVVLLLLVAVGLVLIFKENITELVESVFEKITSRAGKI